MSNRLCNCPHCGQPMPETRHGVRLTALKARIFDMIERSGPAGMAGDDVFDLVLRDRGVERSALKAHLTQINDALEETGVMVRASARGGAGVSYRIAPRSSISSTE